MKYFLSIVLLFITFLSFSQETQCKLSIQGAIKGSDGEVLVGATIRIDQTNKGAISDYYGNYSINDLCAQEYRLIISFIGYNSDTILLKLTNTTTHNFVLTQEELMLENIQVTAEEIINKNSGNDDLSGELLERAQGGSLGESLEKIVGVTTLKTGPGIVKPVIHGLHSNRVLILNNGIRQEGQQWGSEHAPEIDPFIASKLTVVKGAETVRYGSDAIGGLIIVEPPDLHKTDAFGGEFNISSMTNSRMGLASGTLEGTIKNIEGWAWRVQGTIKRAGDSKSPEYNLTNTGIQESNYSAGFGYKKEKSGLEVFYSRFNTEIGILQAAHIGNLSDLQAAIAADRPGVIEDFSYDINYPKQKVIHNLLKIENYYILPKNKKLKLLYGGQGNNRQEFDVRRTVTNDLPSLDLTLNTHTLDLSVSESPSSFTKSYGISSLFQTNRWDPSTGKRPLIPWFNQFSIGSFGIGKWYKERWEAEIGIRYDYKSLLVKVFDRNNNLITTNNNFHNVSINGGFSFDFSEKFGFSTQLGTAWRPPHVSELFSNGVHHGTASYEVGLMIDENENIYPDAETRTIHPENSLKWINNMSFQTKSFSIKSSLYNHLIYNFIYLTPEPNDFILTSRGSFPVFRYQQINTWLRGIDVSTEIKLNKNFEYHQKTSLIRANNLTTMDPLVWIPADQFENSLHYEMEPDGKIEEIHFSIGSLFVNKQKRVPVNSDFSPPPEGYLLFNLHFGLTVPVGINKLHFYLNLDNVFDTSYRSYLNRLRYFADDTGRNITFRIKYDFHHH